MASSFHFNAGDSKLELSNRYRACDDFVSRLLHGIFVIAQGRVMLPKDFSDLFLKVGSVKVEVIRVSRKLGK
jgi:hypothetical protein